jgi:WD40 repeat protein
MQSTANHQNARRSTWLLFLGLIVFSLLLLVVFLFQDCTSRDELDEREIDFVHAVAFCPDGRRFVTGSQDGTVRLWDAVTGEELRRFGRQRPAVTALAVSADGRYVFATANESPPYGMFSWEVDTGHERWRFLGHEGSVKSIAVTPDGSRVLSAGMDKTIRVWDVQTGRELQSLRGHDGDVNAIAVSPDGRFVLSGGGDYWGGVLHEPTARLWELATGETIHVFQGHTAPVQSVAFHPNGTQAASCDHDGAICIWDVLSGEELQRCQTTSRGVFNSIAFAPDGRQVLSGSGHMCLGGSLELWDGSTGQLVRRFPAPPSSTHSVAWSPDGRWAVSGHSCQRPHRKRHFELLTPEFDGYGVACVWDVATGREMLSVGTPPRDKQD